MKVQIVNKSAYETPAYATEKSAGMDLKANITEPVTLGPLERALIPTGIFMALPDGTEAQVRPRSGLAAKYGISVLNAPGTIDADYRGEVKLTIADGTAPPGGRVGSCHESYETLISHDVRVFSYILMIK